MAEGGNLGVIFIEVGGHGIGELKLIELSAKDMAYGYLYYQAVTTTNHRPPPLPIAPPLPCTQYTTHHNTPHNDP